MTTLLAWVEAKQVGHTMKPEVEEAHRRADEAILGALRLARPRPGGSRCTTSSA